MNPESRYFSVGVNNRFVVVPAIGQDNSSKFLQMNNQN